MALIPPDLGVQLKAQTESQLNPVTPVRPWPADLPDLHIGQAFTARIVESLPDNTYKALVAGKQLTLQLPEGASPGDTLELVVIDRSARAVIAQLATRAPAADVAAGGAYPFARLSVAGRMIGQLLANAGEAPQPLPLNRGQPVVAQPPSGVQELLPALQSAVARSGFFYESHQAQWVAGKLPLASLLQEPQGRLSAPQLLAAHGLMSNERRGASEGPPSTTSPSPAAGSVTLSTAVQRRLGTEDVAARDSTAVSPAPTFPKPGSVAEELRPMVQQQLEAFAGQRLMWQGEVWPGQDMDWRIEWEQDAGRNGVDAGDEPDRWRTSLSLTMPRLGRIDATLQIDPEGIRIALATPYGASAGDLRDELPRLAHALGEAGLPPLSLKVKHDEE